MGGSWNGFDPDSDEHEPTIRSDPRMVKSWNDRLSTPSIHGIKPSPRTVGDVLEDRSILVPAARKREELKP